MTHPRIRFSDEVIAAFRRLSHDANPLHSDVAYARRTPLGQPVVYGMLGVIAALQPVLAQGPVRLRSLRCAFPGPLYREVDYDITREDLPDSEVRLKLSSGGVPKVDVTIAVAPSPPHPVADVTPVAPVLEAAFQDPAALAGRELSGTYAFDPRASSAIAQGLDVDLGNLPPAQLQVLGWISYACGMLIPGRQSLIGNVQLSFANETDVVAPLSYHIRVERFDARFGSLRLQHVLKGRDAEIAVATINAFARPLPVSFSLDALREHVPASDALRGRTALVTGGTRGLGAYVAGALAARGADVIVNYRSDQAAAELVAEALRSIGGRVWTIGADVATEAGAAGLARTVVETGGRLEILVNNASPPIQALAFEELGAHGLVDFVTESLQSVVLPTRALLPVLRRHEGTVVTVSSEYAGTTPARFSHYAAAKLAIEGVMQTLAREEPGVRFLVARPPKLLTDQTNTNFDLGARLHPAKAAARIADAVVAPRAAGPELLTQF